MKNIESMRDEANTESPLDDAGSAMFPGVGPAPGHGREGSAYDSATRGEADGIVRESDSAVPGFRFSEEQRAILREALADVEAIVWSSGSLFSACLSARLIPFVGNPDNREVIHLHGSREARIAEAIRYVESRWRHHGESFLYLEYGNTCFDFQRIEL